MSKKNKIISAIVALIVAIFGGGYAYLGGAEYSNSQIMMGSVSNLVSLPNVFVEANSTTTDSAMIDGGVSINQFLNTKGVEQIVLNGEVKSDTATSSCYYQLQISNDGTNWVFITGNSTSTEPTGTSTLQFAKKAGKMTPGLATTTFSFPLNIPKADYTRLLFAQDNLSTDPNDGCQAYIEANLVKKY